MSTSNMIKKIKIGTESRDISAKYDENGDLITTYAKAANVYTKTEADAAFMATDSAYLKADTYSKTEADAAFIATGSAYTTTEIDTKFTNYYVKTDIDDKFDNVYSKEDADEKFLTEADIYTKDQVDETLTSYVKVSDLSSYVTQNDMSTALEDYYTTDEVYDKEYIDGINQSLTELSAGVNTNCVKKDELDNEIQEFLNKAAEDGSLEIKAAVQKYITFKENETLIQLDSSKESDAGKIVKIIIYAGDIEDADSVGVKLDMSEAETLSSSFIRPGATYEIYQKIVICKDTNGNARVFTSPYNSWGVFSIQSKKGTPFSAMVYREDWEEKSITKTEE